MVYQPGIRDILFVEPADEIPAVVDKIRAARFDEIALVVPYGARIFASPIDMLLLEREAGSVHKTVTVISSDPTGRAYAQAAGMAVADRIEELAGELIHPVPSSAAPAAGAGPKTNMADVKVANAQPAVPLIESAPSAELPAVQPARLSGPEHAPDDISAFHPAADLRDRPRATPARRERSMVHLGDEGELEAAVLRTHRPWTGRVVGVLAVVAVAVAGAVAYTALPRATVEIVAKTEPLSFDVEITADKAVSAVSRAGRVIPGQLQEIRKSGSREFPATGERDVAEKAKGTVTVYNGYSSSPQTLVATTRLLSSAGKLFRTIKTVTIPGAKIEEGQIIPSSLDVDVVADAPGADYNVGPSDFTIPGFEGTPKFKAFTGKSRAAMAGGAKGRVKVVTAGDLDGARRALEGDILETVKGELKGQVAPDLTLLDGASTVLTLEAVSSVPANGIADRFTYTVQVIGRAMVFRSGDLGRIIDETLRERLADNRATRPESRKVSYAQVRPDFDRGTMALLARVEETLVSRIDGDALKRDLAGRNQLEAQQYVDTRPTIDRIQVTLWPFWVRAIPRNPAKIEVRIR